MRPILRTVFVLLAVYPTTCSPLLAADVELVCTYADKHVERSTRPLVQEGSIWRFRWKASDVPTGIQSVEVQSDLATAKKGEAGYFVMPNGFLGTFRTQDGEQSLVENCMPIFGMKTPRAAFVAIITGMPHSYTLVARARQGVYRLFPRFALAGRRPYEDIAIDYHVLSGDEADYSGMARAYRNHQFARKACVPLKERITKSPELAYAAKSVEVRIRQAWKPAPSPVEEQTHATEPPMKVAVTFERVGRILDEFKRQGIDRAEVCLVGWNQKGHDGRYPQLFPVEKQLGGEAKLKELTQNARKMGFQIVAHTNSSDAYRISNVWDEEYIIKNADRKLSTNACWSGGRMYNVCPRRAYEQFAAKDLPAVANLGFRGLHYIDVLTIVRPRECFDPNHPLSRGESASWIDRTMRLAKNCFGGVASEGPFDFCCGNLDYVLYVSFGDLLDSSAMIDRVVPIWQLVYHGTILSTPSAKLTNYPLKGDVARLKLIEFGGRPMFYFYSRFRSDNKQWMGEEDLTCEDDRALAASVTKIKQGYDEFNLLAHLQTEFMERHDRIAANVFQTTYSDGSRILVNYGDTEFTRQGQTVGPRQYRLTRPTTATHKPDPQNAAPRRPANHIGDRPITSSTRCRTH